MEKRGRSIFIQHIGDSVPPLDIEEYRQILKKVGYGLDTHDTSGKARASLEEYMLLSIVFLEPYVLAELYSQIEGNVKWDAIKFVVRKLFSKLKGKKCNRITSKTITEQPITFGVKAIVDKNTKYDFSFTDLDPDKFDSTLDKMLEFLKEQTPKQKIQPTQFVRYDKKKGRWVEVNVLKELREKHQKSKNKK